MLFDLDDDGIDTPQLVTTFEEGFGIYIPDRDAENLRTAGQVADYIGATIGAREGDSQDRCICAASFYRTRRELARTLGINAHRIQPTTRVEQLLPLDGRRDAWRRLQSAMSDSLPPLEFPAAIGFIPFCFLSSGLFAALASSWITFTCGIGGFLLTLFGLAIAEYSLGNRIPKRYRTVGQISALRIATTMRELKPDPTTWTRGEVWQIVRHQIAACAGVLPSEVERGTDFLREFI